MNLLFEKGMCIEHRATAALPTPPSATRPELGKMKEATRPELLVGRHPEEEIT